MKEKIKVKLKEKMGGKAPQGKKPMGKKEKVKQKMPY